MYRIAFVPALLAAVLAMFSLQDRPRPLPQGLAADVLFDGRSAATRATAIAEASPDRSPGSRGNQATARLVATRFEQRGFRVVVDRFGHAGHDLVNVIGRRAGATRRQIVVMAERDASVTPDAPGSASDTAALLELARVFEGRATRRTLVLASVDGSTLGEVGTIRLAELLGSTAQVDAVLVISDLGARRLKGRFLQTWSNDSARTSISLQRTAVDSIRQERAVSSESSSAFGQLARLSFPVGVGAQGPLLERGFDALRISGSGELPPGGNGPVEAIDEDRLGTLGRATLRTVTAVDEGGGAKDGPGTYLLAVSQVVPGWALALLSAGLLLPVLAVTVDAFARARRRRIEVLPWLRWVGSWVAALLCALAAAEVLALLGATPAPPPAPVPPADMPLDGAGVAVIAAVAAFAVGGHLLARRLAIRPVPELRDPTDPGAGVALALAIALAAVLLWLVNPFAALLAVPAAHLWTLTALTRPSPPRRARAVLVGIGALPPLIVWLYHLFALSLDPLESVWYLLLLVTGHDLGLATALIGCLWLAALGAVIELTERTPRERPRRSGPAGPRVYGPGRYAGPGSLGGTESALRR